MKKTSENIKALLETNAEEIIEKMIEDDTHPSHEFLETDKKEFLDLYMEYKSILLGAIDSGELDKISAHMRNSIFAQLKALFDNLTPGITNVANYNNSVTYLHHLINQINATNLPEKGSKHEAYSKMLDELKDAKDQYLELKESLEGADSLEEKGREKVEELQNLLESSSELYNDSKSKFDTREEKLQEVEVSITETQDQIKLIKDSIDGYKEKTSEDKDEVIKMKAEVLEFFSKIISEEEKLRELYIDYEGLSSKLSDLMKATKEQKVAVDNLITHATGASLFHAFDKKRARLNGSLKFWLSGVVISLSFLAIVGFITASMLKPGVTIDKIFWVRLLTVIPLGYLVVFLTNQYSKNKNLLEEYSFKSSLSLSLEPYRDLVEKVIPEDNRETMSKFLIDSIGKIYESPTENVFKYIKEDKKVINLEVLDKILKHVKPAP